MPHVRTVPYRVVRRQTMRVKHVVYLTPDHKAAVDYVRRAQATDQDAHYSIDGRCHTVKTPLLIQPMP